MSIDPLLALGAFAFASSITPGPNNLMLLASGANFGLRRSIPHMLGVGIGFVLMLFLVGMGLIQIYDRFAHSHAVLSLFSVLYMSWLAWKIATASAPQEGEAPGRPITFLQAAAFQWVNPKAWAMALTAVNAYAPERDLTGVLLVALTFGAINLPSVASWAVLGQQMRKVLSSQRRLRLFNITMAAVLIASLYPILFSA